MLPDDFVRRLGKIGFIFRERFLFKEFFNDWIPDAHFVSLGTTRGNCIFSGKISSQILLVVVPSAAWGSSHFGKFLYLRSLCLPHKKRIEACACAFRR